MNEEGTQKKLIEGIVKIYFSINFLLSPPRSKNNIKSHSKFHQIINDLQWGVVKRDSLQIYKFILIDSFSFNISEIYFYEIRIIFFKFEISLHSLFNDDE